MSETNAPDIPEDNSFDVMRVVYISLAVLVGLFFLLLVLAIVGAVTNVEAFGPTIQVIRDIVLIFLALEGILIVLALVILIAQVARLVNLLQNEVQPVLTNTQETVQHARGTVEFVSENISEPVIKTTAFVAGVTTFVREAFRLREAVRPTTTPQETQE